MARAPDVCIEGGGKTIAVLLALCVVGLVVWAGCGGEDTEVWVEPIEPPPGGSLGTVVSMETGDSKTLFAPAGDQIFRRDVDEQRWQRMPAQWPVHVEEPGMDLFELVNRRGREGKFVSRSYFIEHNQVLWAVALPAAGRQPMLLRSVDMGHEWEEVAAPQQVDTLEPEEHNRSALTPSLRWLSAEGELYLVDGHRVWRMTGGEADADGDEMGWEPVSLAGVGPVAADGEVDEEEGVEQEIRGRLPARIRHYRPATDEHPYELVTLFGRQMKVYRRGTDDEQFRLVSTLDAIDVDVVRDPIGESIFVVDAEQLYRSDDDGEHWTRLEVATDSLAPEDFRSLELLERDESPQGYEMLLMGADGTLWRSDDGGEQWEQLLRRDPDRRGLTGLVTGPGDDELWVATQGRGMLRSPDGGNQWQEANQGLRAAEILYAMPIGDQRMYVGTDAGLFERSTVARLDDWTRIDDRATSALLSIPEQGHTLSGTLGGGIVVGAAGQQEESSEALPLGDGGGIEFVAPHQQGGVIGRSAVVAFSERPDSRDIVAWSHRQGPMITNDRGESWRRMPLGEAFQNAIEGTVITDFLALRDQTYFAVIRSRRPDEPTQLWHSGDGGRTWQATYSLMETDDETPLRLLHGPEEEGGVMMIHGSRLALSVDRGETWSTISGPWEAGAIIGADRDGDEVVMLINVGHSTELVRVDNLDAGGRIIEQYRVNWPSEGGHVGNRPVGLVVRGNDVLLHRGGRLYSGGVARTQGGTTGNVSLVVAFGAVLVLTTVAFGVLRSWEIG